MAQQTLTPAKVTKHLSDTASASASASVATPQAEKQREPSPPLSQLEKHWDTAIDRKAAKRFAEGIVDDLLQDVITEVIGTIKVEFEAERSAEQSTGSQSIASLAPERATDPEIEAAIAAIIQSPRGQVTETAIEDIPTGITGRRLNLPSVCDARGCSRLWWSVTFSII